MSKILNLGNEYDLWLSYTWSNNNHGICGHTFEVIDYYYILKEHFKVGILIGEDIDWEIFYKLIKSKYSFTEEEISDIKNNIIFSLRPTLIRGRNILFTDGGVINSRQYTLLFDNIFYFACGNKEIKNNNKKNVFILQDDRVYEPVKLNGINYKKKILFDKLKPISKSEDRMMLYVTKNCRNMTDYSSLSKYEKPIIAITDDKNFPKNIKSIDFVFPPVADLFEQFTTYIYTPIERKWDCSPRFIAECKYYGKQVIYHNIDYWEEDLGLFYRKWDLENDFNSLYLKSSDEIADILKDIIC